MNIDESSAQDLAVENYFSAMNNHLGENSVRRLRFQMDFQYQDIEFRDCRIIDIGGGNGIHGLYAASKGAREVLIIEPEDAGSTAGVINQFCTWKDELALTNIDLLTTTLQEYNHVGAPFDVIIIQDAINHFDEEACVNLTSDTKSKRKFQILFSKIASFSRSGSLLHFSECSSKNFYPSLGLANPFDPGIEWEKHQPPDVWIEMLKDAGFELINKRWSSPSKLGKIGRMLFGGAIPAYFFTSHFVVTMKKK